jgi:hypothetical protein
LLPWMSAINPIRIWSLLCVASIDRKIVGVSRTWR